MEVAWAAVAASSRTLPPNRPRALWGERRQRMSTQRARSPTKHSPRTTLNRQSPMPSDTPVTGPAGRALSPPGRPDFRPHWRPSKIVPFSPLPTCHETCFLGPEACDWYQVHPGGFLVQQRAVWMSRCTVPGFTEAKKLMDARRIFCG